MFKSQLGMEIRSVRAHHNYIQDIQEVENEGIRLPAHLHSKKTQALKGAGEGQINKRARLFKLRRGIFTTIIMPY